MTAGTAVLDDERFEASRFVPSAGICPVAAGLVLGAMVIARAGGRNPLVSGGGGRHACPVDGNVELPKSLHENLVFVFLEITEADGRTTNAERGLKSVRVTETKTHLFLNPDTYPHTPLY